MSVLRFFAAAAMAITFLSTGYGQAVPTELALSAREEGTRKLDVAYIQTPQHVVDVMLHLARVKQGEVLYDLGCGDARIAVTAAKRFGCRAVGVDIDPARVDDSRQHATNAGVTELVTIRQQDVFDVDLSKADVVTMYLTEDLNVRLLPQLQKMKPGSRIVSHAWDMRGVEPTTVVSILQPPFEEANVYLWEVPLKRVPAPAPASPQKAIPQRNPLDDVWQYVSQHAYQRALFGIILAALSVATLVATVQARRYRHRYQLLLEQKRTN